MNRDAERSLSILEYCHKNNLNCNTCANVFYNEDAKENYCYRSLDPCRMTCYCAEDNICLDYRPGEQGVKI